MKDYSEHLAKVNHFPNQCPNKPSYAMATTGKRRYGTKKPFRKHSGNPNKPAYTAAADEG